MEQAESDRCVQEGSITFPVGALLLILEDAARRKIQDVLCILNDTKNYIARVDALFSVDSLVIFAETFNYVYILHKGL